MEKLLKLAEKIEDKKLRKKVVDFLKDITLSNKHFQKYSKEDLNKAGSVFVIPSSGLGPVERDVFNHTVILTKLCIQMADFFKENYGLELNRDELIAASLLHDMMKVFEYKRDEDGDLVPTGIMLDHTMLAVAELYRRDFPENVIHIVAAHFGESGPTSPRNFEALVFHHLDSLTSVVEYYHLGQKQIKKKIQEQIAIRMKEKELKRPGEKGEP